MSYPYIIQGGNVTVVIDNKPHTISKTHFTYQKIVDAIKADDWNTVKDVIEPKKAVINYGKGNISVKGDQLFWKDKEMHGAIVKRMVSMLQEGFPIEPLVLFMENMMQNPSHRSVNELYGFLEKNSLPITPDGHFLAYKKVRGDYMDIHSGTFDNSVGEICEMERNEVDDDQNRTCSSGLHFCSQDYLPCFGSDSRGSDRVMILKINPADVVSIPTDYNNSKGRTCRYEVIGEVDTGKSRDDDFDTPIYVADVTMPEKPAQEYDSRGRPLSMTPNAIRKRKARAEALSRYTVKVDSTEYCRGYQDGYTYEDDDGSGGSYGAGYEAGMNDIDNGNHQKYAYRKPGGWPNPV